MRTIRFILNAAYIEVDVPQGLSVLDFLRDVQRLTGTKEGCKEGDCGACNVMIGRLVDDGLVYEPMPSCMVPMGELNRSHLVTIEGLRSPRLSTIQSALVDSGAVQCGFCTPGFVLSLTAWVVSRTKSFDDDGLNDALSGNACRCTGYAAIKKAAHFIRDRLNHIQLAADPIVALCDLDELPAYFRNVRDRLLAIPLTAESSHGVASSAIRMAGGTDLYCQQRDIITDSPLDLLGGTCIKPTAVDGDWVRVDARMSFEAFASDPIVNGSIPDVQRYNNLIASWPVRVRATLAGNLCNASPIGDMTCLLLAVGAVLEVDGVAGSRRMPLENFFLGYKKLNMGPVDRVAFIRFPQSTDNTRIHWEKISKRRTLDIATVNSAMRVELEEKRVIRVRIAMGGVAATPILLSDTAEFLMGKEVDARVALEAARIAQSECHPIDDVRGSAVYRRLLVRQLVLAHFIHGVAGPIDERRVYEAI